MSEADPAIHSPATAWTLGPIVDADAHVEPPFEMWKDYLPANLRDLAPTLEEGDEFDCVVFEGRKSPLRQLNNAAGRTGAEFKFNVKRSEMRPVWLPEVRLKDMDDDGIDQAVIFGGGPLGTFNNEQHCVGWNKGDNPLPLVLVDDVADAQRAIVALPAAAETPPSLAAGR